MFALVSLENFILLIGGYFDNEPSDIIMRYEIDNWTYVGRLLTKRFAHSLGVYPQMSRHAVNVLKPIGEHPSKSAIVIEDRIFVIGGVDFYPQILDGENSTLET